MTGQRTSETPRAVEASTRSIMHHASDWHVHLVNTACTGTFYEGNGPRRMVDEIAPPGVLAPNLQEPSGRALGCLEATDCGSSVRPGVLRHKDTELASSRCIMERGILGEIK